jgi:hypothetical protein
VDYSPKPPKLEAALNIDIAEIGQCIEDCFADSLKPAPTGIYVIHQLAPVMVPGQTYQIDRKGIMVELGCPTTYKQLLSEKVDIRNINGAVVLQKIWLKEGKISDQPFGPYRGVLIAKAAIDNIFENFVRWRRYRPGTQGSIAKFFIEKDDLLDADGDINPDELRERLDAIDTAIGQILNSIETRIMDWVCGRDWNIYATHLKGRDLCIERFEDWRVWDWMERYERGEITL